MNDDLKMMIDRLMVYDNWYEFMMFLDGSKNLVGLMMAVDLMVWNRWWHIDHIDHIGIKK